MKKRYAGMTVNERLHVSGFLGEFDEAVSRKYAEKVRRILEKVELDEKSIAPILEKLDL